MYKEKIKNYFEQWKIVWRDPTLSANTKVILEDIKIYRNGDGKAWPSMSTLGKNLGKNRNIVSKAIKEATDRKLLLLGKHGTKNQNEYKFCEALDFPKKNDISSIMPCLHSNSEGKIVGSAYVEPEKTEEDVKCNVLDLLMQRFGGLNAMSTQQELSPEEQSRRIGVMREGNKAHELPAEVVSPRPDNISTNGEQDPAVIEKDNTTPPTVDEVNVDIELKLFYLEHPELFNVSDSESVVNKPEVVSNEGLSSELSHGDTTDDIPF